MKTPTTASKRERLLQWQAVHKQLLQNDAQYRKRHTSFLIAIVCLSCVMLPFYLPFFGVHLFGFVADVSIISCLSALIINLAVRQILFQNQKFQGCLALSHDT